MQLDQATVVAAVGVLVLISAIFAVLGAFPRDYAFLEQIGQVVAPLLCVPAFSRFREAFLARKGPRGHPAEMRLPSYRCFSFALFAALVLTGLALFFDAVSIWQKALLYGALAREGVVVDQSTLDFEMSEGDDVVVTPLMFLASVAVGWKLRTDRVPWPVFAMATIFVLMIVVRMLHLVMIGNFLLPGGDPAEWSWSDLVLDVVEYPVATLVGCLLGFLAAIVLRALASALKQIFPTLGYAFPEPGGPMSGIRRAESATSALGAEGDQADAPLSTPNDR